MDPWTKETRRAFGQCLKAARQGKGMTLAEVGAIFDSPKQTVGNWESGVNMPNAEQVAILSMEYGASLDWLLLGRTLDGLSGMALKVARLVDQLNEAGREMVLTLADNLQAPMPRRVSPGPVAPATPATAKRARAR